MNEYEKWSVNGTFGTRRFWCVFAEYRVWTGGAVENVSYNETITIMHYDAERVAESSGCSVKARRFSLS